jgi:hypothetical protein
MARLVALFLLFATSAFAANIHVQTDTDGNPVDVDPDSSAAHVKSMYRNVYITDADGDTVNVTGINGDGALDVAIQDQHTELVDLHFYAEEGITTFAANWAGRVGQYNCQLSGDADVAVGDYVFICEGRRFYDAKILEIGFDGDDDSVRVDTPFDYAFTTAAVVSWGDDQLTVDGSGTAIVFRVSPQYLQDGVEFDIVRFLLTVTDGTAMDDGTFGGMAALPRGVVFRTLEAGEYHNIFNAKTNGGLAEHCYDVTYASKPPAGSGHGMRARRTFAGQSKNGVTVRLCSSTNDALECVVQDNTIPLATFTLVAQGHIVE